LGDIGVTENFFSVGGHSLKTVALSVEVNRELGLELPITAIYLSQTIEQQAAFLSNRTGALPQFVHRLNPSGSPLLFCFPPITGFAWSYASLARRVTEYNIYGFDFIEDADRITLYADTIQAIAKGAAVRLCGYSAGGTLAFLVAKEIESRGGSVRKLLLLDANRAVERSGYSDADIESTLRECLSDPRLRIYVAGEREKEQLSKRVRDYGAFLANTCCIGQVHAEIELLLAYPPAQDLIDKWRNASTQSFRYWNAEGSHNELLDSHNLDRNGPLIAQALGAGQPKTYEAMAR
jgi:thioesterase domain-containing protein